MTKYCRGSRTVSLLYYYFVFIPNYRKQVLRGDVATRLRDLIRRIYHGKDIEIIRDTQRSRVARSFALAAEEFAAGKYAEPSDAGCQW